MRTFLRAALLAGAVSAGATLPAGHAAGVPPIPASAAVLSRDGAYASPAGDLPPRIRPDGSAILPDGRFATPAGRTMLVDLEPLNVAVSADSRRLYVSSEGMDDDPSLSNNGYQRYISVVDTATWTRTRVRDDQLDAGMAETPDGRELWVSEGEGGTLGVFRTSDYRRIATVHVGAYDYPFGLAMAPDGRHVVVAGFRSNTLDVVDTTARAMVSRVATGQYPSSVALSPDGSRAYVTNWGLYNPEVVDGHRSSQAPPADIPPVALGGYNTDQSSSVWSYDISNPSSPTVVTRTRVGEPLDGYSVLSGSLPGSIAVSPDGRRVAVTASNNDLLVILDAVSGVSVRTVDLRVFGSSGPTGAQPDGVTWSRDGGTLYVAEGGRDTVALVDAATGVVRGRIPTGWYPSGVALSHDGSHLYVSSVKGLGSGPNGVGPTHSADKAGYDTNYIDNLLRGTVQDVPLAGCDAVDLARLTALANADDGYTPAPAADPSGGVVPTAFGGPGSSTIKHVVVMLKENRTYDQVLGDLAGGERDQHLNLFGQAITPNEHAIARRFATGDNFSDIVQDSVDGHWTIGSGQDDEWDQKLNIAGYTDVYGATGNILTTAPENLPVGGFSWNNVWRAGKTFRVYGETRYLVGLGPATLDTPDPDLSHPLSAVPPAIAAGFDPAYPSDITMAQGVDDKRATVFNDELSAMTDTTFPAYTYMVMNEDHTQGYAAGAPTPETYVSENDHAVGRVIDALSHTSFWDDTAVFVVEDDTQDGQDHVDAHRTVELAAGGHVRRGYLSHVHHSNWSMQKTIDLILGLPPISQNEVAATSMADYFTPVADDTPYTVLPETYVARTNPATPANATLERARAMQDRIPEGIDPGGALSRVIALTHDGEAQAGLQVSATPEIVEHTLPEGAPAWIRTVRGCAAAAASEGAAPGVAIPNTATAATSAGAASIALTAAVLALARRRRRRRSLMGFAGLNPPRR